MISEMLDDKKVLEIANEITTIFQREIKKGTDPMTAVVGVVVALDSIMTTIEEVPVIGKIIREYVTGFLQFRNEQGNDEIYKQVKSMEKTNVEDLDSKKADEYF